MMFSLVISTLDRTQELEALLESLVAQTERNFEVIIVDQNSDDRLDLIISKFREKLALQRLRSAKGLSRARNRGLAVVKGDIVAFPDDDCVYPSHLLAEVRKRFERNKKAEGITFAAKDGDGRPSGLRWVTETGPITKKKIWRQAISYTVFLRRSVIQTIGPFDERLGAGANSEWQAGEETDYLLRALNKAMPLYFDPSLHVIHPRPTGEVRARATKAYSYGLGLGHVVKRHGYPLTFKIRILCGPIARALYCGAMRYFDQAAVEVAVLSGRFRGLVS